MGVKDSTCTLAVYGELGRFPVYIYHFYKIVKYWLQLLSLSEDHLVKKAYIVQKQLTNAGFNTWASKVKAILSLYNLEHYWHLDDACDVNFLKYFRKTIQEQYIDKWHCEIKNVSKLSTFITFKTKFEMEKYLLCVKNFKLRKLLTKLRLSSHDLYIEKGRYSNVPREKRICNMCNLQCVETEEHFILHCPFYQEERVKLFAIVLQIDEVIFEDVNTCLIKLLSSNSEKILFSIGRFLQICFKKRNEQSYK